MLIQKSLYEKYGVRTFDKLKAPMFFEVDKFELPKETILHHMPEDDLEFGPNQDDFLFNGRESSHVWHIEKLTSNLGSPRFKNGDFRTKSKAFHKKNRHLRLLRKFEQGIRDDRNLVVCNYAPLTTLFHYTRSALTDWNKWMNINKTLWENVGKVAKETLRNQYIHLQLPVAFPEFEELKLLSKKPNLESLEPFKTYQHLMFWYLWEWATQGKHELDDFLGEQAALVNLIVESGGKFSIVNMGLLQEWKREQIGEDAESMSTSNQFLVAWLRYLTKVQELSTVTGTEEEDFTDEDLDFTSSPYVGDKTKAVDERAKALMASGAMSAPEYKRALRLANKFNEIPATNGKGTLADQATVTVEELNLPDSHIPKVSGVSDEGMLESSLLNFDSYYVENIMEKDFAAMALNAQNVGIAVTDFKRKTVVDAANKYHHYTVQFTPLKGKPSTVHFKVPVVGKDGKFLANGVTYYMAKQRGDLPIRKTKPHVVALTSYYGKTFVFRSERAVYDRSAWAVKKLSEIGQDEDNNAITDIHLGKYENKTEKLPPLYTGIASGIVSFKCKSGTLNFDYRRREDLYGELALKKLERRGHVVCGQKGNKYITVDTNGLFHYQTTEGDIETIGTVADLIGVDMGRQPNDMVELKVFDKKIPVAICLGYMMGLRKLLRVLKVKYRKVPRGQRTEIDDDEKKIVFHDYTIIYKDTDRVTSMILEGFYEYRNAIKTYNLDDFDKKDVYQPVLESRGLGLRYIRELELIQPMFIDPITDGILERRKEPRSFEGLLMKSAELLKDDRTPDETATDYMRFKGYERFTGLMYKEMVAAIRKQQASPMSAGSKVEMNPKAVWMSIISDATVKPAEQLNPIHNLKEKELVTYSGDGGRSARSMTAPSRVYHPKDMGIISEATVDSGSVAINTSLSANPSFASVRGDVAHVDIKKAGATKLLSTSAVLSPGATSDDPKRTNFTSIQHSHGVAGRGYKPLPVNTGYDKVLAHRVDDMFACTAREDGKVVDVSDKHIVIEYKKDKSRDHFELGTIYGIVTGTHVPQRIMTDLSKGQSVKQGHVVAWNTGYFERDLFDQTQVVWKAGCIVNVALMESVDTLEDSCAISENLGGELATETTVVRNIAIDFKQDIQDLVKVGDDVDLDTILCTLVDPLMAESDYFDEASMDSLKVLGQLNPKAKNKGTVERIEVLYNGDPSDMSKSLRSITTKSDKERAERVKRLSDDSATTGRVNEPINVDGRRLILDQAVIKVYITKWLPAGVGDKGVLGNQLKSIIGRVMTGVNETESGEPVDVIFSRHGIGARIVLSPDQIGTTNKLLEVLSKKVAQTYFDNK